MVVTRNSGLTADDKVNELVVLWVAVLIVVARPSAWATRGVHRRGGRARIGLVAKVNLLFGYNDQPGHPLRPDPLAGPWWTT
ncbi:MAG: hypothetical protein U0790_05335 [Isosphaeraceae bacterium]